MSRIMIVLGLLLCCLMTGCANQQILDRVTLFIVCGLDKAPHDQIEYTLAATKFHEGKPGSISNQLYTRVGHTSASIKEAMDMRLSRTIHSGKLSVILIGSELAADGVADELDMILRDAQASRIIYLAVVEESARELLQSNFSSGEEKGLFLYNLLHANVKNRLVPGQNLHEFEYALLGKGMDPFLPLLAVQNDQFHIAGLALFQDDKYVMRLNEKQMMYMKLLKENVMRGALEVKLSDHSYVAASIIRSKVRYEVEKAAEGSEVSIHLQVTGELVDTKGMVVVTKQKLREIETSFEQVLTSGGMDIIQLVQKKGIDPLGLGDVVRGKTRNWNAEQWEHEYPTLNVNLKVKVNLVETGIKR